MSGGDYTVDLSQLFELIERLEEFTGVAYGFCHMVGKQAEVIVGHWEGESARAYHDAQIRWDKDAKAMAKGVVKMREHVMTVLGNYTQALAFDRLMWEG